MKAIEIIAMPRRDCTGKFPARGSAVHAAALCGAKPDPIVSFHGLEVI
jgi:hypothetical protein